MPGRIQNTVQRHLHERACYLGKQQEVAESSENVRIGAEKCA